MSKFKVGDKVRIVGNTNMHKFDIGDTVTLEDFINSKINPYWYCTDSRNDSRHSWYVQEGDMEAIEDAQEFNPVSKPVHYNHGDGIECIAYIKQVLGPKGFVAYCRGNQIKYQHRAMYKGKPVEDLEKAHQYNAWAIETLKEMEKDNK